MTRIDDHREALRALDPADWPGYLDAHSGLPGPRGNLELAQAVADLAEPATADALVASGEEYRTFCGVIAWGARAGDAEVRSRLREYATDERWRVREAVAMALQRLGDRDVPALTAVVLAWADDADPLVQRAAAAGVCEPRLLTTPDAAAVAVEVCRRTTYALAARPSSERRDPGVRTLRQGLGYCWSVAVAADPTPGLAAFTALRADAPGDADLAWIVRSNLAKKRLARLL